MNEPRYKVGLTLGVLFPQKHGRICAFSTCSNELPKGKWRWCSGECLKAALAEFWIRKGDIGHIRKQLFKRDAAVCAHCKTTAHTWEADHIVAVVNGGGGCDLSGYQTLCIPCHKVKTRADLAQAGVVAVEDGSEAQRRTVPTQHAVPEGNAPKTNPNPLPH